MSDGKLRFSAVISHPIQHYSPIFSRLAADPAISVRVFYLTDFGVRETFDPGFNQSFAWDVDLLHGHDYRFLRPGFTPKRFGFLELDAKNVTAMLEDFSPHLIWVHGYGSMVSLRTIRWARGRSAVVFFGDSEPLRPRNGVKRLLKKFLLPRIFSRCDAFVTIGDNNEAYYALYGVPVNKMFRGACPIDLERFTLDRDSAAACRKETRQGLGIPEDAFVALTSGKIDANKRILDLVEAVAMTQGRGARPIHALMIGDGVLRPEVERRAGLLGVADRVKVTGFVNQSRLPAFIAAGDVLVQPSAMDAHPLSVTEALPAGLPIIASDRIGCVGPTDTARPGVNALVYPRGDVARLAAAITALADDHPTWERYAAASREIAKGQDFSAAADAVRRAIVSLRPCFARQWSDVDAGHFSRWRAAAGLTFSPDRIEPVSP